MQCVVHVANLLVMVVARNAMPVGAIRVDGMLTQVNTVSKEKYGGAPRIAEDFCEACGFLWRSVTGFADYCFYWHEVWYPRRKAWTPP